MGVVSSRDGFTVSKVLRSQWCSEVTVRDRGDYGKVGGQCVGGRGLNPISSNLHTENLDTQ